MMNLAKNPPECLDGYFVIANNNMPDTDFDTAIILIIKHTDEGVFGIIVNKISNVSLRDVAPDIDTNHSNEWTGF
jgi:putative transcriptional regulator